AVIANQGCSKVLALLFRLHSFSMLYSWWSFNPCLYSLICSLFHPAIHEFPEDIFTKGQRRHGAILLHVFCAVYMFYALAIVCDVYFVPSLEKICENLHLSEDVAGATFMAAGSSAPELFTSLIGQTSSNVSKSSCSICIFTITLTWWPLFRDAIYYILSVLALILVSRSMTVWETIMLISMYGYHVSLSLSLSLSLSGQNAGGQDSPVVMVDELMSLHPHQFSFSEASLRVMITPHFSPRTRLSMAGRMLITEVLVTCLLALCMSGWDNKEADEEQHFRPLTVPEGRWEQVKWVFSWPLGCLLYYTVPNCVLPCWESWFMVTFVASTLWIAVFSYLMVWMVTIISFTLDIPDVIMGITFLAAGTSVPDCMASLIVARQGMGDMAVSNSIGSNIFDILLGLGFPWALRTLVVDYGSTVSFY
uniref:Solute carrier family 24 member 6a n=1 Tax=Sinocyclocheilus grahami TaxID=75366 RepID=A0A672NHX2_SINGR